jgi:cytochrome P450
MRRRKLMLPPFHGQRMRAYEETIAAAARAEVARWPHGAEFPLRPGMQAVTLEVILTAVFGVAAGDRRDRLRDLLSRVLAQTRRSFSQVIGILTRPLGRFGPYGPFQRLLDETDALLAAEIAERRRDSALADREDILSMLVAARFDDGSELNDAELRDQLMTLLVAGHETTATALSWAFDLLLHDPAALERARAAAREGEAAHLDAIATEAQRLRPVITSVGRRLGRDGTYAGNELPAGTSMMVSTYLLHTRPDIYPDPYAFRPERFTEGRAETYSWLPFGGGIRRCIGAAFAQLEMRVVLREVLAAADLRAASPRPERAILSGITLVPRDHVRVVAA